MKAYLLFAKNEFLSELAYRFNAVLRAVSTLIAIYVEIAIWHALYAQSSDMQTSYGVISLTDMIAYAVMSAIVNTLVRNRAIFGIDDRIKTGDIAFDLNRPLSFWGMLLSKTIGQNGFTFLFQFVFISVFVLPFFSVPVPTPEYLLYFLIILTLGFLTRFLLAFMLGLCGFWYMRIWHMERVLFVTIGFFSGSFVPLWFFPEIVGQISEWLPFKGIFFNPISVFLMKLEPLMVYQEIFKQTIWVAALALVCYMIWQLGIKKLTVQGG